MQKEIVLDQEVSLSNLLADFSSDKSDPDENLIECGTCRSKVEDEPICMECGGYTSLPTLHEWGKKLPIGIVQENGSLNKQFDLVPLNWKIERNIDKKLASIGNDKSIGTYINIVLSHTITKLGDIDLLKHSESKRILIFNKMYMGDVFYLYAYLRFISLGTKIELRDIECFDCSYKFNYYADISTMEIVAYENFEKLKKSIKLKDGFEMQGSIRKNILLQPTLWSAMTNSSMGGNRADTFASIFNNTLLEIEGLPKGAMLSDNQFDQFSKYDMELCRESFDQFIGGPVWTIEGNCPKCNVSFFHLIDWNFENFFALSSRLRRRKKR